MLSRKLVVSAIIAFGLSASASTWAATTSTKSSNTSVAATTTSSAPINVNTADLKTIENIKGLGPSKAQAIIDYRNKNGNFQTVQDLQKVPGIGPKLFEKIQAQVTV